MHQLHLHWGYCASCQQSFASKSAKFWIFGCQLQKEHQRHEARRQDTSQNLHDWRSNLGASSSPPSYKNVPTWYAQLLEKAVTWATWAGCHRAVQCSWGCSVQCVCTLYTVHTVQCSVQCTWATWAGEVISRDYTCHSPQLQLRKIVTGKKFWHSQCWRLKHGQFLHHAI